MTESDAGAICPLAHADGLMWHLQDMSVISPLPECKRIDTAENDHHGQNTVQQVQDGCGHAGASDAAICIQYHGLVVVHVRSFVKNIILLLYGVPFYGSPECYLVSSNTTAFIQFLISQQSFVWFVRSSTTGQAGFRCAGSSLPCVLWLHHTCNDVSQFCQTSFGNNFYLPKKRLITF